MKRYRIQFDKNGEPLRAMPRIDGEGKWIVLYDDIKHLLEPREDKLIVATMYRYGDRELHSYVLGAYSSLDQAMNEGEKERQHRGNKYEPGYKEVIINKLKEIKGGK